MKDFIYTLSPEDAVCLHDCLTDLESIFEKYPEIQESTANNWASVQMIHDILLSQHSNNELHTARYLYL